MTTTDEDAAPSTPGPVVARWRRLLRALAPSATPAQYRAQPRSLHPAAAYSLLLVLYLGVFGLSLVGQALAMRNEGDAAVTAPGPDQLWNVALAEWASHAVLMLLACAAVWATARATRVGFGEMFAPAAPGRRRRRQAWAVGVWMFLGCGLVMMAQSALALLQQAPGGHEMTGAEEMVRMVILVGPTQITTAFIEESVVVGCLVMLLGAAQRPVAEIATVAALARIAYHAYFGWSVLVLGLVSVLAVWLYRRTGRLWPIIAGHAAYNAGYTLLVLAGALALS